MSAPRTTIGVNLGGSKVRSAAVTLEGRVLRMHERRTRPERGPDAVLTDIVACIREACLPDPPGSVLGVGVGVAGRVAAAHGVVR